MVGAPPHARPWRGREARPPVARPAALTTPCADHAASRPQATVLHAALTHMREGPAGEACAGVVRWLVARGADANCPDETGCTPLDRGVWLGVPRPLLQTIISLGGRARGASPYGGGDTLLHAAVKKGDADFVRELVAISGTEIDEVNERGEAPLLLALTRGSADATRALLAGGARAVCGLTGGIALGNLAVQQDHEAAHADSSDGRRRAARLYARAVRVLRGALRCSRAQPQPHPCHRPCPSPCP